MFYVVSFITTCHIATAGQFKEHLIYFTPREKQRRVLEYRQGVQPPRRTLCAEFRNTTASQLKVIYGLPAFLNPSFHCKPFETESYQDG